MSTVKRILVVDDEPENIRIVSKTLRDESRQVTAATDGQKALDLAFNAETRPDLILLDVMMPGMDGHEVCRRLKADERTRDIPVIFVTAMTDVQDEAEGFHLGAVDYIAKPFNRTIVEARVRTHLELKEKTETIRKEREELREAHERLSEALERLRADIQHAGDIQSTLLPTADTHPFSDRLSIVTRYEPEMEVGGDFYDFKAVSDRHLALILADVSGHGLQAAFVTGLIKTFFTLCDRDALSPSIFCARLNQMLCQLTPMESFATVIYGVYDLTGRVLHLVNAGHQPVPIWIPPEGTARSLPDETDMVLGLDTAQEFRTRRLAVPRDAKLLLATDGLTDATDPEGNRFGLDRLLATATRHAACPAREFDARVFAEVHQFMGGTHPPDDIAMITLAFL